MAAARSGAAASCGPDGALYVCGGSSDGCGAVASCERIDPREGKWHPLCPLPDARAYVGGTFGLDGALYVAGGHGWLQQLLPDVSAYDPRADAWRPMPALRRPRANLALVLVCPS